jgi:hypothetical protein
VRMLPFDYLNDHNVAIMLCLLLSGSVSSAFSIIVGESRNQLLRADILPINLKQSVNPGIKTHDFGSGDKSRPLA